MALPRIIVTGYPHSGTSFVAHLLQEFGLSLGTKEFLKPGNVMNTLGHFEHMALRNMMWEKCFINGVNTHEEGLYNPYSRPIYDMDIVAGVGTVDAIGGIAETDNIEVYKDTAWPFLAKLLPKPEKVILVKRDPEGIYQAPIVAGLEMKQVERWRIDESMPWYREKFNQVMFEEPVDWTAIDYEMFSTKFEYTVRKLAWFVEVPMTPKLLKKAEAIWQPQ